jgi:hypothetical protein
MKRKKERAKAQALVEFALIFPLLLFLIYGVIEVSLLAFTYASVNTAAREAARYGVAVGDNSGTGTEQFKDCATIKARAEQIGVLAGIRDDNITIEYDKGPDTSVYASCPPDDVELGDRIIVKIDIEYHQLIPMVGFPSTIPMHAESRRTIVKSITP